VEQAAGAFEHLRGPQGVFGDMVHVAVVFGEIACRIFEVPEEIGPGVVAAQPPDVALGVLGQHRGGAAADGVDVIDLPAAVVQERHRGPLHQDVVVIGGAAQEHSDVTHGITDPETQPVNEKGVRTVVVGTAEHEVTEPARADPLRGEHPGGPGVDPVDPARPVDGRRVVTRLLQPRCDHQIDGGGGPGFHRREPVPRHGGIDPQGRQARPGPAQVVGVVGGEHRAQQPTRRCFDHRELMSAVEGGEPSAAEIGEAEVTVERLRRYDIRHPEGDGVQPVQRHLRRPARRRPAPRRTSAPARRYR
jgi:hypothetical protein